MQHVTLIEKLSRLTDLAASASESAFLAVWGNDPDAEYDRL